MSLEYIDELKNQLQNARVTIAKHVTKIGELERDLHSAKQDIDEVVAALGFKSYCSNQSDGLRTWFDSLLQAILVLLTNKDEWPVEITENHVIAKRVRHLQSEAEAIEDSKVAVESNVEDKKKISDWRKRLEQQVENYSSKSKIVADIKSNLNNPEKLIDILRQVIPDKEITKLL